MKTLSITTFEFVLENYLVAKSTQDVLLEIDKKFRKGNKEVANLIATEIMSLYDVIVESRFIATHTKPIIRVTFRPKKKRLDK